MAVAAGCSASGRLAVEPVASHRAAGSLVLRRMDRRGHQERQRRPAPAGASFGGWCLGLHNEGVENLPCDVLSSLKPREGEYGKSQNMNREESHVCKNFEV